MLDMIKQKLERLLLPEDTPYATVGGFDYVTNRRLEVGMNREQHQQYQKLVASGMSRIVAMKYMVAQHSGARTPPGGELVSVKLGLAK